MKTLEAIEEYKWLRRLGVSDEDARRALRLARRSTIVRLGKDEAIVAVPSQRLGRIPAEKIVSHRDLLSILAGRESRIVATTIGELPEEQQIYMVKITANGAECSCPATRLAGDPLCIHKLAAAIILYQRGREDLLKWLPRAIEEKRKWRETRKHKETSKRRAKATHTTGLLTLGAATSSN